LFRYCEGIIDLDAEVSDGAFDFGVAKHLSVLAHQPTLKVNATYGNSSAGKRKEA
jgi:hypothetical protein